MVTSPALRQSYDCPSAGEVTMKDMDIKSIDIRPQQSMSYGSISWNGLHNS